MKRAILALLMVATMAAAAHAGGNNPVRYKLFGNAPANTDSNETFSRWFPVEGAARVYIRLYTTHAAFTGIGAGDPDSTFSDSLSSIGVWLSDSIGVNRFAPFSPPGSVSYLTGGAIDSLGSRFPGIQGGTFSGNDSTTMVSLKPLPSGRALRGPSNGWGYIWTVAQWFPQSLNATTTTDNATTFFGKRMMKISITPLRRLIAQESTNGGALPAAARVNGLKGLYGEAIVYYLNK